MTSPSIVTMITRRDRTVMKAVTYWWACSAATVIRRPKRSTTRLGAHVADDFDPASGRETRGWPVGDRKRTVVSAGPQFVGCCEKAAVLTSTLRWYVACERDDVEEIRAMMAVAGLEDIPGVWPIVARALCAAHVGETGAARALLDAAADGLPGAERDSEWLPMVSQVVEVVGFLGGHPVAGWAYDNLLPFRSRMAVEGIGAALRGPVERALGVLAAALGRPGAARDHFDAAGRHRRETPTSSPMLVKTSLDLVQRSDAYEHSRKEVTRPRCSRKAAAPDGPSTGLDYFSAGRPARWSAFTLLGLGWASTDWLATTPRDCAIRTAHRGAY